MICKTLHNIYRLNNTNRKKIIMQKYLYKYEEAVVVVIV
jgi:hypothetical protein